MSNVTKPFKVQIEIVIIDCFINRLTWISTNPHKRRIMIGCSIFRWSWPWHPRPLVLQQWTSDFHISLNVARQQSSFSSISQHASFSRHGKVPSGGEFWRRTQLAGRDGGPVAREQPPLLFLLRWRRPPANGQAPPPSGWYSNCLATYSVITSCTLCPLVGRAPARHSPPLGVSFLTISQCVIS